MLPQVEQIDIKATIINAMDMPNNRPNWFLTSDPVVATNDKSRFVKITMHILPRRTGELRLPEIPMSWLSDDGIPNLGQVTVREEIMMGNNTQPLPAEIESVGGFAWKTDITVLKRKLGKASMRQEGDDTIYTTKDGLELVIRKQRLAGAHIRSAGWHLRQARFNFIDRWGDPRVNGINSETPHMTWLIGWLRIHATESIVDGTPHLDIHITREDIENKLIEASMNKDIFKLLESDQTSDELWSKDDSEDSTSTDSSKVNDSEKKPVTNAESGAANSKIEKSPAPTVGKPSRSLTEGIEDKKEKPVSESIDPKMLEDLFKEAKENAKE